MAGARGVRAGRAYVEVGADDSKLQRALRSAQRRLGAFGSALQGMGLRVAAAGAAMVAPFLAASRHFANTGSALFDMANRTGLSVEALSELAYAAGLSGASIETLEAGIRKMQRTVLDAVQGSKEAVDALAELGLTAKELKDLAPEEQFDLIADRLRAMANPTRRAAVAMELLGRSGTELLPMIDSLAQAREEARALGLTIPKDAAERADALGDAIDTLGSVTKNAAFWVGNALAPSLTMLAKVATMALVKVRDWIQAHPRTVAAIAATAAAVTAFGLALVTAGIAVRAFAFTLGALSMALKAVAITAKAAGKALQFMWSRLFLVVTLCIAGVTAILHFTGVLKSVLGWIGGVFGEIGKEIDALLEKYPALKNIAASVELDFDGADWGSIAGEVGRLATAGTFNASAVGQLGDGNGERSARAAEEALKHLKRIEDNTTEIAPRFG